MTPLSRGIISSGKLGAGGGPSFFSSNAADLNGNTQSFTYSNGVCAGEAIISVEAFVNIDSISGLHVFYGEAQNTSTGSRVILYSSGDNLLFGIRDTDAGTLYQATATLALATGTEYHILGVANSTTNTISLYMNGVLMDIRTDFTFGPVLGSSYFADSAIGSSGGGGTNFTDGRLSFVGVYNTDKSSVISNLYNSGDATCYASRTGAMKAGELFFVELANWSGHAGVELVEHVGAVTVTNNNSTPFTGTGPTVEC